MNWCPENTLRAFQCHECGKGILCARLSYTHLNEYSLIRSLSLSKWWSIRAAFSLAERLLATLLSETRAYKTDFPGFKLQNKRFQLVSDAFEQNRFLISREKMLWNLYEDLHLQWFRRFSNNGSPSRYIFPTNWFSRVDHYLSITFLC